MTAYTRTEHLRHELAEQIRNGTLKPGERIMSETRLAEEYQVSRGTVRRALEQLKKAELIETRMGSGRSRTRSRICPPSRRCARSSNEWKDSWTAPSRKP